jgi:hypothetical protein
MALTIMTIGYDEFATVCRCVGAVWRLYDRAAHVEVGSATSSFAFTHVLRDLGPSGVVQSGNGEGRTLASAPSALVLNG